MRHTLAALVLVAALALTMSCAGNTPAGANYICNTPGSSCTDFVSGWTEAEAMMNCNTVSSTFAMGTCPAGRIAHCTVSFGSTVAVTSYYAGFGDGTVVYAQMTCSAGRGDFGAP